MYNVSLCADTAESVNEEKFVWGLVVEEVVIALALRYEDHMCIICDHMC